MATINYKFGTYEETVDGKEWEQSFARNCDSDAQAELEARLFCEKKHMAGIYIRRGAEWYCKA